MDEIRYTRGTPGDRDAIIDFGNYIFSHSSSPTDFPSLLPKLYGQEKNLAECHYLAKAGNRIVGMVGAFPMELNIMGRAFPVRGIGTVSAHPYFRGRGIMTGLMRRATDDMKRGGVALSVLSGRRQRYEHFGYEPCGAAVDFHIAADNLRALSPAGGKLSLAPMKRGDGETVRKALALQRRNPLFVTREPDDFYTVCLSWDSTPMALLEDGAFRGYLVCSKDRGSILELELDDVSRIPDALSAYLAWSGKNWVSIRLPLYAQKAIAVLDSFSEGYAVAAAGSFRIFDYEPVLRQLLAMKASYAPLADGRLVLEIAGAGKFSISVQSGRIAVEKTEDPADAAFDNLTAMRFLFSPMGAFREYLPARRDIAHSWFPLPLFFPPADDV